MYTVMRTKRVVKRKDDSIFKDIIGILEQFKGKRTSVQLQHEAVKSWAKKYTPIATLDKHFKKIKGIRILP